MPSPAAISLSRDEARGLMLIVQGLHRQPETPPDLAAVRAMVERLGVVQIDTINVVRRTQYLVLWSRLGTYDDTLLDQLLHPHRHVFEYWSHAASIVPMTDYPYYRGVMLRASDGLLWEMLRTWRDEHPEVVQRVLDRVRAEGPLASSDFENTPTGERTAWDWYGPKESRRALDILWTMGELMIHSRRGGQKLYDVRERVLADAFGSVVPADHETPSPDERVRYLARKTTQALGVTTGSWLWDYFRIRDYGVTAKGSRRDAGATVLGAMAREGLLIPAQVEGLTEPAWLSADLLPDLERLRAGDVSTRTTLLSPFDSLIWDRARARELFDYEVVFEAYIVPAKRQYGYYCLAILHRGKLVGRLDPKMDRERGELIIRALHLEPGVEPDADLAQGLAEAVRDLSRFLGAQRIVIGDSRPAALSPLLRECLGLPARGRARKKSAAKAATKRTQPAK
jgi:uncharacterized protein